MEISLYRIMLFGFEIEKLKQFYIDNFHFEIVEETKNEWVVLKAGQMELALHKAGSGYTPHIDQKKNETNTKLVFSINTDMTSFRQQLIDNGVIMQDIKSFSGINALFCDGLDIEGNVFQLEQRLF